MSSRIQQCILPDRGHMECCVSVSFCSPSVYLQSCSGYEKRSGPSALIQRVWGFIECLLLNPNSIHSDQVLKPVSPLKHTRHYTSMMQCTVMSGPDHMQHTRASQYIYIAYIESSLLYYPFTSSLFGSVLHYLQGPHISGLFDWYQCSVGHFTMQPSMFSPYVKSW